LRSLTEGEIAVTIIPGGGTLNQMVRRIRRLYSLPAVALQVLELTRRHDADATLLRQSVERDPALCAKVLGVVNGSLLRSPTPVVNVGQAIALLGVRRLQLLVLGMSLPSGLYDGVESTVLTYYWRFSLYKALAAKRLALRHSGEQASDVTFVAALLHDCGMLAMIQELGAPYLDFLKHVIDDAGPDLLKMEVDTLGFDHRVLGAKLLADWQLPESIVELLRVTMEEKSVQSLPDDIRQMAQSLHVADLISHFWMNGKSETGKQVAHLAHEYWGLGADVLASEFDLCFGASAERESAEIDCELKAMADALAIDHEGWPRFTRLIRTAHDQLSHLAEQVAREAMEGNLAAETCGRDEIAPASTDAHPTATATATDTATLTPAAVTATAASAAVPGRSRSGPNGQGSLSLNSSRSAEAITCGLVEFVVPELASARESRAALTLLLSQLTPIEDWVLLGGPTVAQSLADEMNDRWGDAKLGVPAKFAAVSADTIAILVCSDDRPKLTRWASELPGRLADAPPFGVLHGTPLPRLWFGIASMRYVPKSFEPSRLIEPAERCLRAAQQVSGTNVKSIDVV
jgi:HD-like signal output (HDOD) protein